MVRNENASCGDEHRPDPEAGETEAFRLAAQKLIEAVAAEPVPDRLRQLAHDLADALDRRGHGSH